MSGRKKFKMEPSASPSLSRNCLESKALNKSCWLYRMVRKPTLNSRYWINPIVPNCGVNFMTTEYHFEDETDICYLFSLSEDQASVPVKSEGWPQYFPGSQLKVFAPKSQSRLDWLRFVLSPTKGEDEVQVHENEEEDERKVDLMTLCPITLTLQLATSVGGPKCSIEIDCYPGIFNLDGSDMNDGNFEAHVVYHAFVRNTDANWSRGWGEFFLFVSPSLQLVGAKIKELQQVSSKGCEMDYQKLRNPFTLVSIEGERYPSHKGVLSERSPVFSKVFEKSPNQSDMKVSVSSHATDLFLQKVYNPQKQLPINVSIEELLGVLKLAHQYKILDIIASISNRLFKVLEFENVELATLWQLFGELHPLKYDVQILFKLWGTLALKIRRCILDTSWKEGNYLSFNEESYFLNLKSFDAIGPSRFDLLEELCEDLEKRIEGETREEYIKIQLLFKRFQNSLLKKKFVSEPKPSRFFSSPVSPVSSTSSSESSN